MSIVGYLSAGRGRPPLRMPKGKDELGVRFEGAVLTGEKTVEDRLSASAVRSSDAVRDVATEGEYGGVEEYDPVLRAHCRL